MALAKPMKFSLLIAVCISVVFLMNLPAQAPNAGKPSPASQSSREPAVTVDFSQLRWVAMVPEMGGNSPMRALLHEHPGNHSSQFLIQMPPNFHVPAHYHTVNETHTVIQGAFIVEVDGTRTELQPGGFNYTPAGMVHEAWTPKDKGALIFVSVDGGYDLHPVAAPPGSTPKTSASADELAARGCVARQSWKIGESRRDAGLPVLKSVLRYSCMLLVRMYAKQNYIQKHI